MTCVECWHRAYPAEMPVSASPRGSHGDTQTQEEEAGTKFDCSLLEGQYLRDKDWWKRKSWPPALFRRPAILEGGGLIS